jgi:methyl-accepting chemotaxis protein
MKGNINETRANMLRIVFERDKSKLNEEIQAIDNTTDRNKKNQEEYERLPATDEEKKTYNDLKNDLVKFREVRTKVIELAKADNYDEAVKIYNSELMPVTITMVEKLQKCIDINEEIAKKANENNIAQFSNVKYTIEDIS